MRRWRRRRIERRLRRFILEDLVEPPFDGSDPLAEGAVDSLAIEQLVEHVEAIYGIRLADDEIVEENFGSTPALAALVDSKRR